MYLWMCIYYVCASIVKKSATSSFCSDTKELGSHHSSQEKSLKKTLKPQFFLDLSITGRTIIPQTAFYRTQTDISVLWKRWGKFGLTSFLNMGDKWEEKSTRLGILITEGLKVTDSIPLVNSVVYRISISSCFSYGKLYLLRQFPIFI